MTIIQVDSCIECTTRVFNTFNTDRSHSLSTSPGIHRLVLKHRFWRHCADTTFCWGYFQLQTPNPIPTSCLAPRDPPLPPTTSTRVWMNFPPHIMTMDVFLHLKRLVPKTPYSMNFWQNDAKYWDFVWEGCGCKGEVRRASYSAWGRAESPSTHIWTVLELVGKCEVHRDVGRQRKAGLQPEVATFGKDDPRDLVARGLVPENWKDAETESEGEGESEDENENEERSKRGRSRMRRPVAVKEQAGKMGLKKGEKKEKEKPQQEVFNPTELIERLKAVALQ